MEIITTKIPNILILKPKIFTDARGYFFESFNQQHFNALTNLDARFVQDNQSRSIKQVLRGLHYQIEQAQGKLVRVLQGTIFDVAVDIRKSSPTFSHWVGIELSDTNHQQLWIPPGFAHGFVVLSDYADILYKTTDYYAPNFERCLAWDDPTIGIQWPLEAAPLLSEKDQLGLALTQAEVFL